MNSQTALMAVGNDWLDSDTSQAQNTQWVNAIGVTAGGTGGTLTQTGNLACGSTWFYPSWSYPVYVSSPARPIKLALSEVERLRKAARADDKLKAILSKFTDQIEITVDFD